MKHTFANKNINILTRTNATKMTSATIIQDITKTQNITKTGSILLKSCILILTLALAFALSISDASAKKKTYTVTPATKPLTKPVNFANSVDYNKYTKHYFMLRSYLEQIERDGGGKLVLKKGTYNISNSLCIPSNTTLELSDGVKLVKLNTSGKARFKAAGGMIHFVSPKVFNAKNKTIGGYKGVRNVKITGKGTATIDLKNIKDAMGMMIAHSKNVTIENITFKNMNNNHFIELNSTDGAVINNCTFTGVHGSSAFYREAVNIDTPDKVTGGLNIFWSKDDKTICKNITVENCTFTKLNRGIGTHKYSQKTVGGETVNCAHENIVINNNTFDTIYDYGVFMENWTNVTFTDNIFGNIKNVDNHKGLCVGFRGVTRPFTFTGNDFGDCYVTDVYRADGDTLYYLPFRNDATKSFYEPIYNDLGVETLTELLMMNEGY